MSARKLAQSEFLSSVSVQARTTQLELSAGDVRVHKSGIEFRSAVAIPAWTEMTVGLQTQEDDRKVNFTGVVVACNGSRHLGFTVSMVFTSLTPKAQARLNALVAGA